MKEVTFFLGHTSFCRRFVEDFSRIVKPLSNLVAKDMPFHFFDECLEAFSKLKEALTSTLALHRLIWG